jgi:hypothetical protein
LSASSHIQVTSSEELLAAMAAGTKLIEVSGILRDLPSLRLASGQSLAGDGDGCTLLFADGEDGIELTANNTVIGLKLVTQLTLRALFIDRNVHELGRIERKRCVCLFGLAEVYGCARLSCFTRCF